jgi:quinol monooxygenase YgiN
MADSLVLISGHVRVRPDALDQARFEASRMAELSRAEPGCREYRFSVDLDDPTIVRVFECWESEAALATHFETPHFAAFGEVVTEVIDGESEFVKYDASGARPLFD